MNPVLIIANLIYQLNKIGCPQESGDMINLLNDLLDLHNEDEEKEPINKAIEGNGLVDGPSANMNQGFSVEPVYFR